ncbi:RNA polymerase sigma-70 factor, ECF subfamily [Chitinophaga costaii]|uniref:RNA polymerase sigma-70 factor, ECF subfamily n=1 Tax=Chitinophaga costaii TaxID=1335309 RepID=A0A1C3ZLZ0_9BACT|nr:RNA polymerase sigma-70 factor [Chitinophaga costaii]PUZ30428.1 RNA polymerase sigma-70 factor [Chitinophaga costaii]SCB83358.1 RNA polymerase sigma-70 factor, ECF subfamily [Chitinophaga costaii]
MEERLYTEEILLQRFAAGDPTAFQFIFRQHYQALCYFANSIVANDQEAEDLVQESFSKLWDKRNGFGSASSIKAFLFISTKNASLNFIKSRERHSLKEKEFSYLHPEEESLDINRFDPVLTETEIMQQLYAEIERLPNQCRRIFKMSYLEGRKNEDIANTLHLSYNTVRAQKLRALKLIRSGLLKKNILPLLGMYLVLLRHTH